MLFYHFCLYLRPSVRLSVESWYRGLMCLDEETYRQTFLTTCSFFYYHRHYKIQRKL